MASSGTVELSAVTSVQRSALDEVAIADALGRAARCAEELYTHAVRDFRVTPHIGQPLTPSFLAFPCGIRSTAFLRWLTLILHGLLSNHLIRFPVKGAAFQRGIIRSQNHNILSLGAGKIAFQTIVLFSRFLTHNQTEHYIPQDISSCVRRPAAVCGVLSMP